ncbi:protein TASOR isoform X3 [Oreochromis aureus]|uniref:protein TASOR isoform X3 n=1 Tax=Oreochromis aureus TaxID=47969 RepID=UPI0012BC8D92|nr:protein TASOR isoform X3 [Oreochromis aureus]
MDDSSLPRREAGRPRRVSAAAELGANVSLQDGEVIDLNSSRESQPGADRPGAAGGRMERRNSAPLIVHKRHMPKEPYKFHIPKKTEEKKALFQYVSTESREYEDMMTILTSSYIDTNSAGCFTYSIPRLVYSELLEKEFVEKRKEMKAEGRTDKELEECYCFLLTDTQKLPLLCEKGLFVGQSWITVLGNPSKGVYLSRYSDLLQMSSLTPGSMGEIVIFKVMKGKVKSIYENMKNLLDPTPRFDSHISKNASKVTSLNSYRAFELTQQYFYEYSFDELRQRPRQVCPYAVVSFQLKGKDSPLPSVPLAPIRSNSQSAEGSKERAQFTVWTGDLVKGDRVLFQISLCSLSPPFLPHKLPEKLEIGHLMRFDQVTKLLPASLFSYNLYNSSQEVVKNGYYCSLLEVMDRNRSKTSVTRLLHELEIKRVVLVTPLVDKGFLFLLSSVQMATPTERGENWKRCLQALFVFPETRDVSKTAPRSAFTSHDASESQTSGAAVMSRLSQFIPAMHHALLKVRANPPPELSAGVERQAREYLIGLKDGKVRQYPMGEYDSQMDDKEKSFAAPIHHRVNLEGYLRSYLYSPAFYLLSAARARLLLEAHCGIEQPQQGARARKREATEKEATGNTRHGQTNTQKMQQLIDLVLTCKRNAENEVKREEGGVLQAPGRKRKMEQQAAERAIKYLKASQEPIRSGKIPVEGNQGSLSPVSFTSVIGSLGLRDADLREEGSELAAKLLSLLTSLYQAARGTANQSLYEAQEDGLRGSYPFDRLATKLGLPTNCDIDLRKQDELEEQTAGSVSSLEGFSPSSHSGEMNHHGAAARGGRRELERKMEFDEDDEEEYEIPWVLIPITGLSSERYTLGDRNIPHDPRFLHLTTATSITTTTNPPRQSPTLSPEPSSPPSPSLCPSPEASLPPSPSQCPSPDPSLPPSPSQCPSPDPSPLPSPSQCPSPEPSPPPSPSQCPSPQPSSPPSPSPEASPPPHTSSQPNELSLHNKNHKSANEELLTSMASRELAAASSDKEEKPQGKEKKTEEPCVSASIRPSIPPSSERRISSPSTERVKEATERGMVKVKEEAVEALVKEKECQAGEKVQKREIKATDDHEQDWEIQEMDCKKGNVKELVGGSASSASACTDINSIVDRHLGDFSSEIQLLLQEESTHYNLPQYPHSTLITETPTPQHTMSYASVSQFSQYVSFYNPCPSVQDYVDSLKDGIDSMITEFDDGWRERKPEPSGTNPDATLANRVSAFVASVRAANTIGRDDEGSASCDERTAADSGTKVSQSLALSRGNEAWLPDSTNYRNPTSSHVSLSIPTPSSGLIYEPANTSVLCPPPSTSPHSQWTPQQNETVEISRTITQDVSQTQENSTTRTVLCTAAADSGGVLPAKNIVVTLPGLGGTSDSLGEASHPSKPASSQSSVPVPKPSVGTAPPATDLSSLISQLQPDVFNSLVEIIKEVKKNSLQFYIHCTEPGDEVTKDIKELLLKQGNVEQNPITFLSQEDPDNRLLVIIKNKDIAGHIHKIPGLVSLKQHSAVVFVGIDTLDDIRNNSYNELFVAGGCIVSDELVLSPDCITHEQLAALLMFLEQHSSLESVWRWKIHCKTHKKLKEQARFRREAASLLDLLSAYQKRQIVEFLPYHHCDMMNHQSPDLDCLIELQGRYTQYRHTIFLTEHHNEKFPAYSSGGIIVANIDEILHNFSQIVGCHDPKAKQPIIDDMLSPKGFGGQLSNSDCVSGPECSPSIFPEHNHSLSSITQPQQLPQPSSGFPTSLPHPSDQLVPDASCKDGVPRHSDADCEVLRQAILQLRAERQAQLQQLQQQQQQLESQAELSINPVKGFLLSPSPPLGQGGPPDSVQLTPGRKAVSATLDSIHSVLQPELSSRREDKVEPPIEGWRRGGSAGREAEDQRGSTPVRVVGSQTGNQATGNNGTSAFLSNQNAAVVTALSNQTHGEADQHGEPVFSKADESSAPPCSTTTCPAEGEDRASESKDSYEQPITEDAAPPGNSEVPGKITSVTNHESVSHPALPQLQQIQHPQQHVSEQQQGATHLQYPPTSQRGIGLLHPHLPRVHGQPFHRAPMLGPLNALGGIRGLLGQPPLWPGGLGPGGAVPLVWGFQQAALDFTGPSLLGGYHSPAGQGSFRYRGGQRGGFNGM